MKIRRNPTKKVVSVYLLATEIWQKSRRKSCFLLVYNCRRNIKRDTQEEENSCPFLLGRASMRVARPSNLMELQLSFFKSIFWLKAIHLDAFLALYKSHMLLYPKYSLTSFFVSFSSGEEAFLLRTPAPHLLQVNLVKVLDFGNSIDLQGWGGKIHIHLSERPNTFASAAALDLYFHFYCITFLSALQWASYPESSREMLHCLQDQELEAGDEMESNADASYQHQILFKRIFAPLHTQFYSYHISVYVFSLIVQPKKKLTQDF